MVRRKDRYLALEFVVAADQHLHSNWITPAKLLEVIRASLQENFGDFGSARHQSRLKVVFFNEQARTAVLRCNRDFSAFVRTSLVFVTSLGSIPVHINVFHVGGTIKSVQKRAIEFLFCWAKDASWRISEYFRALGEKGVGQAQALQKRQEKQQADVQADLRRALVAIEGITKD
uniref:Uncharacterized protein n=1 Tax=Chromera velia CCMP2878 TaxID=1169474 RepID=A0A0G4F599_9ALVE|mmetsp:Transcript_2225/g.4684  ORF Transcript_2225/g.4684 Transcript_2225/m.4684 type:complete len:174 (-) Transcript_2225:153-674(-)|eukprot:Cvel_150.t1-p1 / transcript=Cvel_150.t1 / gene=Cvel_150 / organism=Chromera_velia_CCMP2878 / gene_product=Ribonucleases P/MRP protein subunit POP5, putative / transcript_product=Ribonucleases P/MRP protein subunit POP5, putative / location=Cvel_scaffold10:34474-36238(-) / protein_length=173 / sequence_SO=supercontig / SO=protein_coding / is_pseudo=false